MRGSIWVYWSSGIYKYIPVHDNEIILFLFENFGSAMSSIFYQVKHKFKPHIENGKDKFWITKDRLIPYTYRENPGATFMSNSLDPVPAPREAPLKLWFLWMGKNELTANRLRNLEYLKKLGIPYELVTNPSQVEVRGGVHPGFRYLTPVHKADYLRMYIMYHHGGIYTDIKEIRGDLANSVRILNSDDGLWATGYPELGRWSTANVPGHLGQQIRRHYGLLMGMGLFAFKPQTPLAGEALQEMERRMTERMIALEAADAGESDSYNPPQGYPFGWTELLGEILHPISLKYHKHIYKDDTLGVITENYR